MRYDLNLLFVLRKAQADKKGFAPIYLRITVNGERSELSVSRKIESQKWDARLQRGTGRSESARTLNDYLDSVENQLKRNFNSLLDNQKEISASILRDILIGKHKKEHTLITVFEENNKLIKLEEGSKYVKATISRYVTTLNRIKEFIRINYGCDDLAIDKLDLNFIRRFEIYLRTEHQINDSTTMKYLKNLKRVIHYAMELGYLEIDPFRQYKTAYKQVNRGYLTMDELKTIEEKNLHISRLDRVRDVFIFACYTGFSYADLKLLTTNSISKGIDGKNWIIYEREKTGVRASIPILPEAQRIIDKYKNDPECISNNMLLPVKSNQKLNSYLSEIEELCEIEKHITMHLARHTFATTVTLSNGVPIETVSKMLGHTNLKTTQIYSKVIDTKISEDMDKVQERLAKRKIS
jgi:site-specific recombinase XerD